MIKNIMNPKVDEFLDKTIKWQAEFRELRKIVLNDQLTETLKWGVPCYMFQNGNVILIHGFKEYCALLFFKGALLKDPNHILIQQTENVQASRQIRFTSIEQIMEMAPTLTIYINEAIEIEKSGVEIEFKTTIEFTLPDELKNKFNDNPALKTAFETLTPGRQRAYILYFNGSKQSKTREARIEKYTKQILSGKGLYD